MQVEPNASYLDWISDAAGAAQSVAEGLDWSTGGWAVGLMVALGLATKFGHLLGPAGSAAASMVQGVASSFLPKETKVAAHRMEVAEETLWGIVSFIEELSPDDPVIKELKHRIAKEAPGEFHDLFKEWKARRPPC